MCRLCQLSAVEQSLINQLRNERGEKPIGLPHCEQGMKKEFTHPNGTVLEHDYFDNQRVNVIAMNRVEFPNLSD